MWFYLGIVSFTGLLAYRVWRMLFWSWGWSKNPGFLRHDGRPYKSKQSSHKDSHSFAYSVTCRTHRFFRIKRETNWDRWAKKIGLSVEFQFSDPEFDALLYVASDDPDWNAELAKVRELRLVLKALFSDAHVMAVKCEGRHIWVEVRITSGEFPRQYVDGAAAKTIVSALHQLADYLDDFTGTAGYKRWGPYRVRTVLLVALSSAILMLGVGELFRIIYVERGDVMIDGSALLQFTATTSLAILAIWMIAAVAWLRGSAHAHLVLGEILVSGGIGLLLAAYALGRDINIEWDDQAATPYDLFVSTKTTGYRRKYGTYYVLGFASPPEGMRTTYEVSYAAYSMAKVGDPLTVNVRRGALGYRWIESMERTKRWASVACTPEAVSEWTKDFAIKMGREGRYPSGAWNDAVQGTVNLEITTNAETDRVKVRVVQSSGSSELDNEAIRAAGAARIAPLVCKGQRVNFVFNVPVRFSKEKPVPL